MCYFQDFASFLGIFFSHSYEELVTHLAVRPWHLDAHPLAGRLDLGVHLCLASQAVLARAEAALVGEGAFCGNAVLLEVGGRLIVAQLAAGCASTPGCQGSERSLVFTQVRPAQGQVRVAKVDQAEWVN